MKSVPTAMMDIDWYDFLIIYAFLEERDRRIQSSIEKIVAGLFSLSHHLVLISGYNVFEFYAQVELGQIGTLYTSNKWLIMLS